jgi:hypothetical protein
MLDAISQGVSNGRAKVWLALLMEAPSIKRWRIVQIADAYWPCPRSAVGVGSLIVSRKYLCFFYTINSASNPQSSLE